MKITRKHIISFIILVFCLASVISFLSAISPVKAANENEALFNQQQGLSDIQQVYGGDRAKQDPREIIGRIINIVLGLLGVIFLGLTVFAGFQYMTAAGNEEQAKKAMALLKNAVIGLVIVLVSWALTLFILTMTDEASRNVPGYQNYRQSFF